MTIRRGWDLGTFGVLPPPLQGTRGVWEPMPLPTPPTSFLSLITQPRVRCGAFNSIFTINNSSLVHFFHMSRMKSFSYF